MNRLCLALTGSPLLNGNQFRDAAADRILPIDGKVWRFSCRELAFDGEPLWELIASDITPEYAKTQALERDKAELSQLNRDLQAHYLSIDEVIRRQEILQARVNIHNEMNRLMLSTTAADGKDAAALDRIFSLWERNALLLCFEAEEPADRNAADSLDRLASALGVRLVRQGALPQTLTQQRGLFWSAAQEAMANAVKHAGAKTLTVSVEETDAALLCRFTNDGAVPSVPPRFTGGLANLALLAERQGAEVSAQIGGQFTLTLRFPKNQPNG